MSNKTLKSLSSALMLAVLSGCGGGGGNSGPDFTPTADDSANTTQLEMRSKDFRVEDNSVISVLFQVKDTAGNFYHQLTVDDLEVLEDNEDISARESQLELLDKSWFNYQFDTVVMLDVSNSILELDVIKQKLTDFFAGENVPNSLLTKQRIALYTFDDDVKQLMTFNRATGQISEAIAKASNSRAASTNLHGAIMTGIEQWTEQLKLSKVQLGSLVVITDGTDTAARYNLDTVEKALADTNAQVHMIGIGNDFDDDDKEIFGKLGTGGVVWVDGAAQLDQALTKVWDRLNRYSNSYYHLMYASPKRRADGSEVNSYHNLTAQIKSNSYVGVNATLEQSFSSYNFTDVSPVVLINNADTGRIGDVLNLKARTLYVNADGTPGGNYTWSAGGNCSAPTGGDAGDGSTATVELLSKGSCAISALDTAHGVSAAKTITVQDQDD